MQRDTDLLNIRSNDEVFDTTRVLSYLHRLTEALQIHEYLASLRGEHEVPNPSTGPWSSEFVRFTGYFAVVQLMRMHSLLGDYHGAMRAVEGFDFHADVPIFYKNPACHITLYYYMGFAYLMTRRYVDAIRTFSNIIIFVSKTSGLHSLSIQDGFLRKKHEQIYQLLLICQTLCPQQLDDSIMKAIQEKHQDKLDRLFRGEDLCYEELFSYACPKFVTAALPQDFDKFNPNEAHQRQFNLFISEVKQQKLLPTIRSYMKLYTAIKVSKLAQLCEMDEEGLRNHLMCTVHKTRQNVCPSGEPPLNGKLQMCSEVEFCVDGDTVHIAVQQQQRAVEDVFLEHITKFKDILQKLDN